MTLHLPLLAFSGLTLALLVAPGCGGGTETATSGTGGGSTSSSTSTSTSTTSSTSTSTSSTGASSSTSSTSSSSGNPACPTTSETMLPGVRIEIDNAACTFSLSDPMAEVDIPYRVIVDQDIPGVAARAQDAGMCTQPEASGLITFPKVDGGGQQYCICQLGKCAPSNPPPVTLKAGTYPSTFTWDKHNWFGPSDTNQPKGPLFPAGDYTMTVSAIGVQSSSNGDTGWVITATMPIHLVP